MVPGSKCASVFQKTNGNLEPTEIVTIPVGLPLKMSDSWDNTHFFRPGRPSMTLY
jgi:hypothetical protein